MDQLIINSCSIALQCLVWVEAVPSSRRTGCRESQTRKLARMQTSDPSKVELTSLRVVPEAALPVSMGSVR